MGYSSSHHHVVMTMTYLLMIAMTTNMSVGVQAADDELILSDSNPISYVIEPFDSSINDDNIVTLDDKNKPTMKTNWFKRLHNNQGKLDLSTVAASASGSGSGAPSVAGAGRQRPG